MYENELLIISVYPGMMNDIKLYAALSRLIQPF